MAMGNKGKDTVSALPKGRRVPVRDSVATKT